MVLLIAAVARFAIYLHKVNWKQLLPDSLSLSLSWCVNIFLSATMSHVHRRHSQSLLQIGFLHSLPRSSCVCSHSLQMNMKAEQRSTQKIKKKSTHTHTRGKKKPPNVQEKLRKIQKNKLQSGWDAARGKSPGKTWKHCRETCSLCTR